MLKWSAAGRPAVIFAVGDSWFDYPVLPSSGGFGFNYDILWQFHELGEWVVPMSLAGSRMSDYITNPRLSQETRVMSQLHNKVPIKGVIVSGGGNDFMSTNLRDFLIKNPQGTSPDDFVDAAKMSDKFTQLESNYSQFILLCKDKISKDIKILGHTYDYAYPSGKDYKALGVIDFTGPWIKNYMMEFDIPIEFQRPIVIKLVDRFVQSLSSIKSSYGDNFDFCDFRGTLNSEDLWVNELHPTEVGFKMVSNIYHNRTKTYFKKA
jgi:hypothetical protein